MDKIIRKDVGNGPDKMGAEISYRDTAQLIKNNFEMFNQFSSRVKEIRLD